VLGKEPPYLTQGLLFVLQEGEQELGKEAGLLLVSRDDSRVGPEGRAAQAAVEFGEAVGEGIMVVAAELGELGEGEGVGEVLGRVGDEEVEADGGLEVGEEGASLRVVALEDGVKAVGVAGDGVGKGVNETEFGAHLGDEGAIGFPGGEAMAVGAEEVGEEEGGLVVIDRSAGGETASGSVDDGRGDDIDLVLARPEEIDEEVVGGL